MLRRGLHAGFTLVEMLVVITIIGILAGLAIPNITKARIKAKETEVKSGLYSIQTSVERFHVDNGQYPAYIAGGTRAGWTILSNRLQSIDPTHADLIDPLIGQGYMDAYPKNPFVSDGVAIVTSTGGNATDPGSGDPRFGQNGLSMGNLMDDPRFYNDLTTPGEPNKHFSVSRRGQDADLRDIPYPTGGKLNTNNLVNGQPSFAANWWPGNFFYRAVGPVDWSVTKPGSENPPEVWSFYVARYESYILGGYGDKTSNGKDVVRVAPVQGNSNYRVPPSSAGGATYQTVSMDNGNGVVSSLPEVMGGGDEQNNPFFPYLKVNTRPDGTLEVGDEFAYGAPDGVQDGIVQVLTPAASNATF